MKLLHIYIIRCTLLVAMLFAVSWTRTWAAEAMAYVVLSSDYASLTFYFDENQNSHSEGTVILVDEMLQTQQLMMNRGSITMVTIDASFANYGPTSTASWFNSMSQLRTLDLSNLTMTNVTNTDEMFSGCSSLTTITVNDTWPTQNGAEGTVTPGGSGSSVSGSNMFNGCTSLVGGAGTPYDASHVDYTYAHIDGGESNPGYFTGVSRFDGLEIYVVDANSTFTPNESITLTPSIVMTPGNDTEWQTYNAFGFDGLQQGVDFSASIYYPNKHITQTYVACFGGTNNPVDDGRSPYVAQEKNLPITGGYVIFEPKQDGSLIIPVSIGATKQIYVTDGYGNVNTDIQVKDASGQTLTMLTSPLCAFSETEVTNGFVSLNVKQGQKYYVFCTGSKMHYGGYSFSTEAITIDPATMKDVKGALADSTGPYAVLADNVLTFYYDDRRSAKNGMGVGPFVNVSERGWNEQSSSITKVVFDTSFAECTSLTSTAYWYDAFSNLSAIESVSNLNTGNVTDMSFMFYGCSNLANIDLGNFNTSKVTDMSGMFSYCSSLRSLNLDNFKTDSVTNMRGMFRDCSGLLSLDLNNFNTGKVTYMDSMFQGCSNLTTITVGEGWTVENLQIGKQMFRDCTALKGGKGTIYDENHVDHTYAHIDGGESNPGYFTAMKAVSVTASFPFNEGTEGQNAVFSHPDYFLSSQVTHGSNLSIEGNRTCAETQETLFTPVESHTDNLTDDDAVTFLISTKAGVTFTPTKVSFKANRFGTEMGTIDAYWLCPDNTTIELERGIRPERDNTGINTVKSCDITGMTHGEGECGLKLFLYDYAPAKHIGLADIIIEGTLSGEGVVATEAYAAFNNDSTVLTFYYDDQKTAKKGMSVADRGWLQYAGSIIKVQFDSSFADYYPTSTNHWFDECSNLTSVIDIENLKLDRATDISWMFRMCSGLTTLDVRSWNTANVTEMGGLFYGCTSLTSLDVSSFNTQKVTNMESMFGECHALTSVDVSSFNTENVTNMDFMFGATAISELNLSNFNTDKVTNMRWMFSGVGVTSVLKTVNLSGFNTSKVTNMEGMFNSNPNLTTIYVGEDWSTSNVTNGADMFTNCTNLKGGAGTPYDANHTDYTYAHIDGGESNPGYFTSGGSTTNAEAYAVLSENNTVLTFYYDDQMNTRGGMNIADRGWSQDAASITKVQFDSTFVNYYPTSTREWFNGCLNLTSIVDMKYLKLDRTTDMSGMFLACTSLTSLDVSGFNTQQVTNMQDMFRACTNLTSLDLSRFNTQNVTEMYGMFYNCTNLKSLDLSNFDTRNVRNMDHLFRFCTNLVNLNISGFSTANGASQRNMFEGCSSLASIQAGNAVIADSTYAQIGNPNLLLYVNEASQTPRSVRNVVVLDEAEQIVLTDTVGNNNFYCPKQFRAKSISYTHNFRQTTLVGVSRGWETIALPFAVQTITHEKNGTLTPFGVEGGKPFWLRELTGNGLVSARHMDAYVPYLISMPNNSIYPDDYNQAGQVTFSATNAVVPVTESRETSGNNRTLIPTMMSVAQSPDIYVINRDTTYQNNPQGSIFVADYREVRPFEAYVKHVGGARYFSLSEIPQLDVTGIESIELQPWKGEQWWTLDGRKLNRRPSKNA